ncbi:MAG: HAMP domain-containing sensor histidine kinase [Clostridia bacterium]
MIKKIQKQFIIIAMVAIFSVLAIIMVTINVINYDKVGEFADTVLDSLSSNNGEFGTPPPQGEESVRPPMENGMTNETPFETRFFTVKYNLDGEIVNVNVSKIFSINEEQAEEYANNVTSGNKDKGYNNFYRYKVTEKEDGKLVIFVDCTRGLTNANQFLQTSIIISIAGLLCVFLLVLFFSKKAMAPIIKSYEKQKHFITDSSHELKTPLTIISANNEITELESGETDCTKSIARQVTRMTSMVKSLTALSKIDEQEALEEKEKFNFSDAVLDVYAQFENIARTQQKILTKKVEENIEYVGDEKIIRQLVNVLLDNAVKYSFNKINVELARVKNHIELKVTNNTNGIEEGNLNKYFDRFYRSDEMRASAIEGNGIGLSIVKEIVELHKGKISAYSEDGEIFVIKIIL